MPPQAWSVGSPQAGGPGIVVVVAAGLVVVVVPPQFETHVLKSDAQLAALDCAVERQPAMHDCRPDPGAHPVTHVLSAAATLCAHVPRSSPHTPRQEAVDGSPGEGEDGLHAWTQLV